MLLQSTGSAAFRRPPAPHETYGPGQLELGALELAGDRPRVTLAAAGGVRMLEFDLGE